jgi:hypothetical protein
MNAVVFGSILVIGSALLSLAGMLLVRKVFPAKTLREHHEVAGYMLSVIGTLYAVLLGLVIVDVQSKYQQAKIVAEGEANAVADLFHLSRGCGLKLQQNVQSDLIQYVDLVIEEWGQPMELTNSKGSIVPLHRVWEQVIQYEPVTNKEQAIYGCMLSQMAQMADSRRFRVVTGAGSVSPVLWAVLIAGGALTVMFTYFFTVESVKAHSLMTVFVTVCISLNVMLVGLFANPYRGDMRIQPAGFLYDQKMFQISIQMIGK